MCRGRGLAVAMRRVMLRWTASACAAALRRVMTAARGFISVGLCRSSGGCDWTVAGVAGERRGDGGSGVAQGRGCDRRCGVLLARVVRGRPRRGRRLFVRRQGEPAEFDVRHRRFLRRCFSPLRRARRRVAPCRRSRRTRCPMSNMPRPWRRGMAASRCAYGRDVALREDASRIRVGNAPQALARCGTPCCGLCIPFRVPLPPSAKPSPKTAPTPSPPQNMGFFELPCARGFAKRA